MKKATLWILGLLLSAIVILYIGASWYFSSLLLASETKAVTAAEIAQAEEDLAPAGIPLPETVTIPSTDGVTLAGYLYDQPDDADCGVVLLHGYTSISYDMASWVPMFWELGCDLITYDARGHGNSSDVYHTFGYYEREDASAVIDWFAAEAELSPSDIGLLGVSYGAAGSLQTLALRSDLAFVIADSAYQDYDTIVSYQGGAQYGTLGRTVASTAITLASWRGDFDADAVSPKDTIQNTSVPVLLIHALEDEYTFASHSETIYANANPDLTVLEITDWGNGHGRSRSAEPEKYTAIVYDFIETYAPQFGQTQ